MPETRLILHVKGTEAETTELPKEAVRTGIFEGRISQSQLIWVSAENTWKQVRELPDLLPGEPLILHVKGTESETAKLPKQAVRAAISKGQITHSQLIWSSAENTWKQVRELPDLLPSQKLAPAPARVAAAPVRKAVEAIIPESPNGPVARAVASSATTPHVRVASAGTPTPKVHVAAAVEGPPRVQVASAPANVPKVRVAAAAEGPPRVQVASAPANVPKVRVAAAEGPPRVQVASAPANVPKVRVAAAAENPPQVRVASAPAETPQADVAEATEEIPTVDAATPAPAPSNKSRVVKEQDGFNPIKWICIGLGTLLLLVLAGNYFLVDRPLVSKFDQTSYSNIGVYAHFGAFIQPTVMVIHLPASAKITADNLPDILAALAHSTPQDPITGDLFARVALTSGWTAQYSFSGESWKQLGDMEQEAPAQRKDFLMGQIDDAGGESIMPESTLSDAAQQTKRDRAWGDFMAHFTAKR